MSKQRPIQQCYILNAVRYHQWQVALNEKQHPQKHRMVADQHVVGAQGAMRLKALPVPFQVQYHVPDIDSASVLQPACRDNQTSNGDGLGWEKNMNI